MSYGTQIKLSGKYGNIFCLYIKGENKMLIIEEIKVKNNCTECLHFISYSEEYHDIHQAHDQGFCTEGQNGGYGNLDSTCNLFKGIKR